METVQSTSLATSFANMKRAMEALCFSFSMRLPSSTAGSFASQASALDASGHGNIYVIEIPLYVLNEEMSLSIVQSQNISQFEGWVSNHLHILSNIHALSIYLKIQVIRYYMAHVISAAKMLTEVHTSKPPPFDTHREQKKC